MFYILKKDNEGNLIFKNKSDKSFCPRGSFSVFNKDDFPCPKAVNENGIIKIVNDDEAQAAKEAALAAKPTKESLLAEVSAATNVEEIKEIVNKVITELL